ncbi:polysaccharide biosynthesis protein [Marinobacter psychrophilus]|uniref:Polysaccharide biosynthesis protein n=1 Tax=Marinobacter psychrophilus TaxID=330734 RepID=A0A0H4I4W3_9GAMM|nr:oligosaccharide flippase family protein [Marinobacter psychrophilus]AKO52760.1 polysaccharide biosynthesis protein [Marinobacter psychrophilus]
MSKIRRAVVFSSMAQYGVRLVGLVTTMIVARLLTPDEVGTFAIASAIIMLLSEFKLLGAADYLIREPEITDLKIRRALGLTILISWGLGLLALALAMPTAAFYDIPQLAVIFAILSTGLFLAPFISIPMAVVARRFEFRVVLVADIVSSITSLATTVLLINLGFSYYSLAWGYCAKMATQLAVVCLIREFPKYWVPTFSGIAAIARFGIFASLSNLCSRAINIAPDLVIGKMGTTAQVGMFSRGLGFVEFLSGTLQVGVSPVVLPYLSEAKRSGENLSEAYTRATVLLGALVWPVLSVASVASLPVIRIFFGDQWDAAAPIASTLAIWLILRSTHNFANNLFIASGNESLMLIKEAILMGSVFGLVIFSFPMGLQAVAKSFIVLGIFEIILVSSLLTRAVHLKTGPFFLALLPNLMLSVICAASTVAISHFVSFNDEQAWRPVGVIALCLPIVWLVSLKVLRHPLYGEIRLLLKI